MYYASEIHQSHMLNDFIFFLVLTKQIKQNRLVHFDVKKRN